MKPLSNNRVKQGLYSRIRNHIRAKAITQSTLNAAALLTAIALPHWPVFAAAPPAGSSIGNQASATYTDSSGVERIATSNVAITIVQQVASFTLTADNVRLVPPGGQVAFPHTILNTGNGIDSFTLSVAQLTGDSFNLLGVEIFADANGDGIPDNTTPITTTGSIPVGGTFKFVVVGTAPSSATDGQTGVILVTAASVFAPSVTAFNTDTAIVSVNAVVNVTKSINTGSGLSPSGPYTFILSFNNTGNSPATSLTLADVIPLGMTYVANSGRWSGSLTPLTDAAGGDPAGILYDFGVTQAGRVTATIATLNSGQSGTLTFQVNVDSGLEPGIIVNSASYTYDPGTGTSVGPFFSNTAQFMVLQIAGVTITGQTITSVTQGAVVSFTNVVVNTGNGVDSFDVTVGTSTFPPGTTFTLFQSDGISPLLDSNNNGIPGTGPIEPGGSYNVVLRVTLPSGISGAGPYSVQKTARSIADPTQVATATDTLETIEVSTVDLTNDSPGPAAPGAGIGPETLAVRTVEVDPGQTARFTLYVNNTSAVADSFNLSGSIDSSFATVSLPTGWILAFRNSGGAVITGTGVIPSGGSALIHADITVPSGTAPATIPVYFRALSPITGAMDRKTDAVTVNQIRTIKLEPNNTGQVSPGGSVVYSHFISNEGNVLEGDGIASTVLLRLDSSAGFTSVIYWDQNNNGVLDPTDPVITNLSSLLGGINGASTEPGLDPGEQARIFVKVFAPVNVGIGTVDLTTLTAVTSGGLGTVPPAVSVSDVTTVISGDIVLLKEQALDANCDGIADGAFTTANLTSGAVPGACVRYRITVTNNGSTPALDVLLHDSIPTYTTYHVAAPIATTVGTVEDVPASGGTGTLRINIGTLTPGQSAVITFGVEINQ
jgi:trimeric autotransporter adhesin